jgi:hypothetical protein
MRLHLHNCISRWILVLISDHVVCAVRTEYLHVMHFHVNLQSVKNVSQTSLSVLKEAVKLSCSLQATTHHSAVMIARYRRDDTACLTNVRDFCPNSQSNRRMWFHSSAELPTRTATVFRTSKSHQQSGRKHLDAFRTFVMYLLLF